MLYQSSKRNADGLISGGDIRPTLLKSGLDTKALATIWMEIDDERRGMVCGALGPTALLMHRAD